MSFADLVVVLIVAAASFVVGCICGLLATVYGLKEKYPDLFWEWSRRVAEKEDAHG